MAARLDAGREVPIDSAEDRPRSSRQVTNELTRNDGRDARPPSNSCLVCGFGFWGAVTAQQLRQVLRER